MRIGSCSLGDTLQHVINKSKGILQPYVGKCTAADYMQVEHYFPFASGYNIFDEEGNVITATYDWESCRQRKAKHLLQLFGVYVYDSKVGAGKRMKLCLKVKQTRVTSIMPDMLNNKNEMLVCLV